MVEAQEELEARFAALRDARTGPVFFIEHGLGEAETAELISHVRAAIALRPLDSGWWDKHKLPLIIAATEVGYRYRGTGTDYWPILEEEVSAPIGSHARERIRDRFAAAATVFRGARPPTTPWAQAFGLIAWPITHALVPLEFHRALALTLANLRSSASDLDDEELYRAIQIAARNSTARFSTLLESPSVINPVVRSLLGDASSELSPEAIRRIGDDLAADDLARRSLSVARRIQRSIPRGVNGRTEDADDLPPITGVFQLRRRDGVLTLEASFPTVEPERSTRLRKALRRRRFAPKLWGVTARVPSEQLLSGLPFIIRLESAPPDDAALFPELTSLDIDEDLHKILQAYELKLDSPLLFAVGAEDVGRLVRGPTISGHRVYWVLTATALPSLARCPAIGEIGPYTCYCLDPTDNDQRFALEELGFALRFGISVAFVGSPPLDANASIPVFVEGDQRIAVPRRSSPEGLLVELDGNYVRVEDDEFVRVIVANGEHQLRVQSGEESRTFPFKGVSAPASPELATCTIDVQSHELTVQALLNGSLTFSIDSFAPLENLEFIVELEAAGKRVSAFALLAPLPQTITSRHEPFRSLLEDNRTRELLLQSSDPMVHLHVGTLCTRSLALERRVRPCWWVRGSHDGTALWSELGALPYGVVAATAPHLPPSSGLSRSTRETETVLLAPMGLDSAEYGPAALFTTLCVAPSKATLEAPPIPRPHLQRRRRAEHSAAGLEDLVVAYLRWSLAETDTLIAEIRRRQITHEIDGWITEICCGPIWRERELAVAMKNPWALLLERGGDAGLGRDSYIELPERVWREILEIAIATLRHELPALWSLARPPCDLVKQDWDLIWMACDRAYEHIKDRYLQAGNRSIADVLAEADASADFQAKDWQGVFEAVLAETDLASLAALLLPTDTAFGFMSLDPSGMYLDDLSDELARWAKESQRALAGDPPSRDVSRAIIALWTEPEVAVNLDWRGALDTLLSERAVARAARYLALRNRQAKHGGSE